MIRRLLPAIALFILCLSALSPTASAFDFFGGVDCNSPSNQSSAVCSNKLSTDPTTHKTINPVNQTLMNITNIVAYVGGAAAVIVIIISALRFVTSGSDVSTGSRTDTDVENARRSLGGALIGLAVIVLARTIILFVLNRL